MTDQTMKPCREAFSKSWNEIDEEAIGIEITLSDTDETSIEPLAEFWFTRGWQAAKADQAGVTVPLPNISIRTKEEAERFNQYGAGLHITVDTQADQAESVEALRQQIALFEKVCGLEDYDYCIAEKSILEARDRQIAAYEKALTPSSETKVAYNGEFAFPIPMTDIEGNEFTHKVFVPWTTIKEIMAVIKARALASAGNTP